MLNIIPRGEGFKWNLPSSMADYANLRFKNYIPDKDISENILTENSAPLILQKVPLLDDFVETLLVSQTDIMGPLSRLWKGLGSTCRHICNID